MAPGRGPRGPLPKISNPGKLLGRLLAFLLSRYWLHYLVVIICIVLTVFSSVQGTLFLTTLIDDYIEPMVGAKNPDFSPLLGAMSRVAVFYLIGVVASFVQQKVLIRVAQGTIRDMRNEVFSHMQELPIRYFDTHAHGDIMSVYTNDIDTIRQMVSQSIPQMFNSAITVVTVFINMCILSIPLTCLSVFMVIVTFFVSKHFAGYSSRYFLAQQKDLGALNGFVEEMLTGQKTVRAYGREAQVLDRFDEKNNEAVSAYTNAEANGTLHGPIVNFINNVSLALVCCFGAVLFLMGKVRLGDLSSFVQYSRRFSGPINEVANIISEIQSAFAAAERVFRLLDTDPEPEDVADAEELTDVRGDVRLENVDFSYIPGQPIIKGLNLHAPPGSLTAIVGPTGAGKTTIINLLMRFYDVDAGHVYVDGKEIRSLSRASLRKAYSMVLQDTWLFQGTIFDNIAYGKPDATMEEVVAAAKAAHIHGFIRRLPQGYDTVLSDNGTSISKGQKQLLTIARAMLLNAQMLILDEATSNVDTRTEQKIQAAMRTLMEGKTCFVIAHRLSTIEAADNILVLEGGQVVEQGTHESLMEQQGVYYKLYQSQFDSVE